MSINYYLFVEAETIDDVNLVLLEIKSDNGKSWGTRTAAITGKHWFNSDSSNQKNYTPPLAGDCTGLFHEHEKVSKDFFEKYWQKSNCPEIDQEDSELYINELYQYAINNLNHKDGEHDCTYYLTVLETLEKHFPHEIKTIELRKAIIKHEKDN